MKIRKCGGSKRAETMERGKKRAGDQTTSNTNKCYPTTVLFPGSAPRDKVKGSPRYSGHVHDAENIATPCRRTSK